MKVGNEITSSDVAVSFVSDWAQSLHQWCRPIY